jgi:hypothetical protein
VYYDGTRGAFSALLFVCWSLVTFLAAPSPWDYFGQRAITHHVSEHDARESALLSFGAHTSMMEPKVNEVSKACVASGFVNPVTLCRARNEDLTFIVSAVKSEYLAFHTVR